MRCSARAEDGVRFQESEVTGSCEHPMWVLETNLGPLQEYQMILAASHLFSPQIIVLFSSLIILHFICEFEYQLIHFKLFIIVCVSALMIHVCGHACHGACVEDRQILWSWFSSPLCESQACFVCVCVCGGVCTCVYMCVHPHRTRVVIGYLSLSLSSFSFETRSLIEPEAH